MVSRLDIYDSPFCSSQHFVFQMSNVENLSPQCIRQVAKELQDLVKTPPEGIKVNLNEQDITDIQALIEGPGNLYKVLVTKSYCTHVY